MNKKLIKTIASVTCGLGIVSAIPFISTSCCKDKKDGIPDPVPADRVDYPHEIFKVDTDGNCTGFKDDFDATSNEYAKCNTLYFSKDIKSFSEYAFDGAKISRAKLDQKMTNIIFAEDSEVETLPMMSFFGLDASIINYLELPKSIKFCDYYAFNLNWNANHPITINFKCNTGGDWSYMAFNGRFSDTKTTLYFTDFNDFEDITWTSHNGEEKYAALHFPIQRAYAVHIYTPGLSEDKLNSFKEWIKNDIAGASDEVFGSWLWN